MKRKGFLSAVIISVMLLSACDTTPEYPEGADSLPPYKDTGTAAVSTIYDTRPPETFTTPITTTVSTTETSETTESETETTVTETEEQPPETTTVPFSLSLEDVPDVDLSDYEANTEASQETQVSMGTVGSSETSVTSAGSVVQTVSVADVTGTTADLPGQPRDLFDTPLSELLNDGRISPYTGREIISHPYSYYTLSENHKKLYDKIVSAMLQCKDSISFSSDEKYVFDDLYDVYQLLYNDEYRLFYISPTIEYVEDSETGRVIKMKLQYLFETDEITEMRKELYTEADKLLSLCSAEMSDYEIVKLFHDNIILNCTYNSEAKNPNSIYGCLVDRSALCQAYSKAFSYLCSEAGIDSYLIIGVADEPHMWNIVSMDGEYYHVDLTWDDPDREQYPDSIRYDYFGLTDERIRELRQVDDYEYSVPAANGTKYQYYYFNNLVAGSLEEAKLLIKEEVLKASRQKNSTVQFICTDINAYNEITSVLFASSGNNIIYELDKIKSEAANMYNTESIHHNINKNTLTIKFYLDYLD